MKLVRYGAPGQEKPAAIDGAGRLRALDSLLPDIDGDGMQSPAWQRLAGLDLTTLPDLGPADAQRLGPCVGRVGKIVCLGLNEKKHSHEISAAKAQPPIVFLKPPSSINGAQDPVIYPRVGQKVDWETELAVVIGRTCQYVAPAQARDVIAGYCVINDLSDRHWQADVNGAMTLVNQAKSFDTFAPLGPWLVTTDEIADPDALPIRLWLNGELMQDFSSADYVYHVNEAVAFCSQFFTLHAGDVIAMGSGPGNAFTWNRYLQVGDRVEAGIEGLGLQQFAIVAEA